MKTLIKNVVVVPDGEQKFNGGILIENGRILAILKQRDANRAHLDMNIIDGQGAYLIPGMIDIHLHGSMGYDFINTPKQSLEAVSKQCAKEGTTAFLASLTVVKHEELVQLLQQYHALHSPDDGAEFLGVHSEGPFLSKQYRALMKEEYLHPYDEKEVNEILDAAKGSLKMMTFAPELENSEQLIRHLKQENVTCMIGHTAASCAQALNAIDKGADGFTNLYNAMSPLTHRNPGTVAAAYLTDQYCELIADGFHVDPYVLKNTYSIVTPKRIILITDAMLAKGMPDGEYEFSFLKCRKKGSTVQVIETGRISGSAISLLDAIKTMKEVCGCTINEIVQMACVNPAKCIDMYHRIGSLHAGKDADLVLLDEDFNLKQVFLKGKPVSL